MPAAPWRIALASAIGTSHLAAGTPCQDSAAHEVIETHDGTILIAVVCDGAGSAAHSDIGSALASQKFVQLVRQYFDGGGLTAAIDRDRASRWLDEVAAELASSAEQAGHALRDYACTLLAAIIGETCGAYLQIGDGAIVVSRGQADGWSWAFWPQHGEFANTTNFVISPNALEVMDFDTSSGCVEDLAIFSDGLENLVLHHSSKTVHAAFFDSMFPPVRKGEVGLDAKLCEGLKNYLLSPRICERTDDDKTLILASRRCDVPAEGAAGETCS